MVVGLLSLVLQNVLHDEDDVLNEHCVRIRYNGLSQQPQVINDTKNIIKTSQKLSHHLYSIY